MQHREFTLKLWLIAALITCLGIYPISADDSKEDGASKTEEEPEKTPAERLNNLMGAYRLDMQKFFTDYRAAETEEERNALKRPEAAPTVRAVLNIIKEAPEDPESPRALAWATHTGANDPNLFSEIDAVIREHFIDFERLGNICLTLSYFPSDATEDLLNHVAETSANASAKAAAFYSLGRIQAQLGNSKQAEEFFDKVVKEFPDAEASGRSISKMAQGQLFETRNLAIGKVAPEIEGKKADGSDFKLSDYRGQVVVIDFFGDW